ncbi:MAG: hypothetical protein SGCHY_003149 [Lobulomycetales sp.]
MLASQQDSDNVSDERIMQQDSDNVSDERIMQQDSDNVSDERIMQQTATATATATDRKRKRLSSAPPSPPISPPPARARISRLLHKETCISASLDLVNKLESIHLSASTFPETLWISALLLSSYMELRAVRRPGLYSLVISVAYIAAKLVEETDEPDASCYCELGTRVFPELVNPKMLPNTRTQSSLSSSSSSGIPASSSSSSPQPKQVITIKTLHAMERRVLSTLGWNISPVTPYTILVPTRPPPNFKDEVLGLINVRGDLAVAVQRAVERCFTASLYVRPAMLPSVIVAGALHCVEHGWDGGHAGGYSNGGRDGGEVRNGGRDGGEVRMLLTRLDLGVVRAALGVGFDEIDAFSRSISSFT